MARVRGHDEKLPFDSLAELRSKMFEAYPYLASTDSVEMLPPSELSAVTGLRGELLSRPFGLSVPDFYLTNPIARSSAIMAECSALAAGRLAEAAE